VSEGHDTTTAANHKEERTISKVAAGNTALKQAGLPTGLCWCPPGAVCSCADATTWIWHAMSVTTAIQTSTVARIATVLCGIRGSLAYLFMRISIFISWPFFVYRIFHITKYL
jgi:hypothetical protein